MGDSILHLVQRMSDYIWGVPLLVLLVGTGIYLTIRLGGVQFKALGHSLYLAFIKRKESDDTEGDISHFQALMTALAATVGTGNIAGVATAIATGGPGALFWMWITGLFGMATKYAEAVLAVKYREKDENGNMCGGPMYYISKGLGLKWLGALFAIFASIAAFGIGNMVQSNSVAEAIQVSFGVTPWITGVFLAVATALVILGGIKSIGKVTAWFVPIMIIGYMAGSLAVLFINFKTIPEVLWLVISKAFTPTAAVGGFAGSLVRHAVRWGVARGVFSNESGLGSSPIAAAAAQTKNPISQALVSMTQTFIDTIVVCSMTGFVILSTGEWQSGKTGAELTYLSFNRALTWELGGLPLGGLIVTFGLVFFAYSTILGWSYYGEKALEYLLGTAAIMPYRWIYCVFVAVGATLDLKLVWAISDVMNGLMAIPNLIGLLGLSGVVVAETQKYFALLNQPVE